MLYPVMPIYLKAIGFSVILIGVLEGLAEATAGLSKGYFGKLSDNSGRRLPFVQMGYALSAISKPMLALFVYPLWVFFSRTIDRLGKGLRTGARDAMLSDEATPSTKGKVFGFHRSMDTLGAVLGPLFALFYLYYHPQDYKTLFFIAFIPGLIAVSSTFYLKSNGERPEKQKTATPFFSFLHYWKESPTSYRQLVAGLLAFTLFNSSDVFLLLKAKETGLDDTMIIGVYIFYNLVFALFAFPLGIVADKFGLKKMFLVGLTLFAFVYFGMATNSNIIIFFGLFFIYGIYAAATEGISKAWISNITDKKDTTTAIGTYSGFQSLCTMLASSLAGVIWFQFGSSVTFAVTGLATLLIVVYILFVVKPPRSNTFS
jgi:MFS family permease